LTTLAFIFRGVEGSDGHATDNLDAAVADYAAACARLASSSSGTRYIASGYSFGAATALLHALEDPRVCGLTLVAPPLGMLRAEDLAACKVPVVIILGDDDEYTSVAELTAIVETQATVKLEVIAGADHFFHFGGLTEIDKLVTKHVAAWLA
jgi:alpha/beta superfamily hydrolase